MIGAPRKLEEWRVHPGRARGSLFRDRSMRRRLQQAEAVKSSRLDPIVPADRLGQPNPNISSTFMVRLSFNP